ncbi:hypothetical protein EDD86DRAFT_147941 [Gorgonomyces haynaldii]|nr:hypothetical protein EDD86DRAFT_147941 [Gorgonomyces haynaldii]
MQESEFLQMHEPNTVLQFEENVPRPSIVRNISLQVQELPSDASQDEIPVPVRHSVPRTTIYVPNLEEMLRSILVVGDKRWPSYSKLIKREGPYYQHPFPKEKHLHSKDKDVKEPRNDFNGLYCLDDIVADPSSGFPTWLYEPYMILPKPFKKPESEKQSITLDTNTVQVTRDFPKYRFESVCRFLNIAFQQDRFIEPQYPVDIATLGPVSNDIVNPQREKTNYLLPVLQGLHGRSKILTHADVVQQTIEKSVGTASLGKIEQKNQKHIEY